MSYIRDKKQNAKKARNKNELLYIEDVLLDLYSKSNLQEKTLIGNRELILYTFFLYLFSEKKIDHENVKTIMSYLDLQLKKPNFIIGLMQSKTLISEFEKKNKLKVIVKTFIEKNEQNEMKVLPLIIEDTQIVLIFNYNGENTDLVTSYITKFVKFAETEFEMLFVSSIGSICHNIEKIGVSYRNARSAILYSALYVQIEPYQYSITRNWDENGKFDFKLVNELVKDINEYKIDHCKQCLNFIMNNIINTHVSYKVYTKIIDTIENAIDVLCKNVKIDLSEIFSTTIAEQIESQYYIADVFHKIESVLTQIFHYIEIQHTNQYMTYVNKAKQFIDQNYNRDISIQDIADKLHITRNYLCRVFKDITSTTMLNYITEIRMKKAKELLQQRNFTVSEISSMVGFNNATYFAKKFKQHFGVTPYQFKINS
ncbi:MAG TPA: hypothetical protein DD434_11955 [Bacteroidales bacterium]|nr:hypothetical protein [Bacteroidales bacterium]